MVMSPLFLLLVLRPMGILGLTGTQGSPPPLSTLLIFVAGSAYYTLYPIGRERISEAIRMFQALRYSIQAEFLTFHEGPMFGARTKPCAQRIDPDAFAASHHVV